MHWHRRPGSRMAGEKRKATKQYTEEDKKLALEEARNKTIGRDLASRTYNVPRSTIKCAANRNWQPGGPSIQQKLLSDDGRRMLKEWVLSMDDCNMTVADAPS